MWACGSIPLCFVLIVCSDSESSTHLASEQPGMGKHCDGRKGADGQAAAHISSNGPVLGPNIACVPRHFQKNEQELK